MSAPIFVPIIAFVLVAGVLLALGLAAAAWGVDSRSWLSDDHNR